MDSLSAMICTMYQRGRFDLSEWRCRAVEALRAAGGTGEPVEHEERVSGGDHHGHTHVYLTMERADG